MNKLSFVRVRAFALLIVMCAVSSLPADVIITNQHVDLTVHWNDGWSAYWDVDDFGITPLAGTTIRVPAAAKIVRSSSAEFDFLGTPVGGSVWILPEIQNPEVAWLGIGALGGGLASPVSIRLIDVIGPGSVSLWSSNPFSAPTVHFASWDGLDANDVVSQAIGGHSHYNWAFTSDGTYDLILSAVASLAGGGVTPVGVFQARFHVIPEPSVLRLLVMLVPLVVQRRRGKQS